ncbi:MAG: hypothetical protein AAF196_11390 [Planctomycetota bacterium]
MNPPWKPAFVNGRLRSPLFASLLVIFGLCANASAQIQPGNELSRSLRLQGQSQGVVTYLVMGQSNGYQLSHVSISVPSLLTAPQLAAPGLLYHTNDVNPNHFAMFGQFADPGPTDVALFPMATLGRGLYDLEAPGTRVNMVQLCVGGSALSLTTGEQVATGIPAWLDPTGPMSILAQHRSTIEAFGRDSDEVRVIWIHGETDSQLGTPGLVYAETMAKMFGAVRRWTGQDNLDVYMATLTDIPQDYGAATEQFEAQFNEIRDAQRALHLQRIDGVDYRIVAHTYDLVNDADFFHFLFTERIEFASQIVNGIADSNRFFEPSQVTQQGDQLVIDLPRPTVTATVNPFLFQVRVGGLVEPFTLSSTSTQLTLAFPPGALSGGPIQLRHVFGGGHAYGMRLNWESGAIYSAEGEPLAPFFWTN